MTTRRGTVVVVEDDNAIRDLLRLHLDLARFEVREASDGRRGLDLARAERFDVIILDVMLPGLDGVTLCRALRAEGASRDAPILMLTARDAESDKVAGLERGADDYVAKPFGIRELLARIEALLRRQRRASEGPAAPAPRIAAGALGSTSRSGRQRYEARRSSSRPGTRSARGARGASRDGLQPRGAPAAGLAWRCVGHRAHRRYRRQPSAPQGRARRAEPGNDPDRVGRRLQIRRQRLIALRFLCRRLRQRHGESGPARAAFDADRASVPRDDRARAIDRPRPLPDVPDARAASTV